MAPSYLLTAVSLLLLQLSPMTALKAAEDEYFMDQREGCFIQGFQYVRRDQKIKIHGRSSNLGPRSNCQIMLEPQQEEDTLVVSLDRSSNVRDPEVKLSVSMSSPHRGHGGSFSFDIGGSQPLAFPPTVEAMEGKATIIIKRPDNRVPEEFTILLHVTAKQTIDSSSSGNSGSGDAGLIIGLVATFIVIIIIVAIIALLLVKKRKGSTSSKSNGTSSAPTFERVEYHEKDSQASSLSLSTDKRSIAF